MYLLLSSSLREVPGVSVLMEANLPGLLPKNRTVDKLKEIAELKYENVTFKKSQRIDIVVEYRTEEILENYIIELMVGGKSSSKKDVRYHWLRNCMMYGHIENMKKHIVVSFHHVDLKSLKEKKIYSTGLDEENDNYDTGELMYVWSHDQFDTLYCSKNGVKNEVTIERKNYQFNTLTKMIDEESEAKVFNVFSYIKDLDGGEDEISFEEGNREYKDLEGIRNYLFGMLGKGKENEDYYVFDSNWKGLNDLSHIMDKQDRSTLYFVTTSEKKLKEEEETRKRKEEEEARKRKEEEEVKKLEEKKQVRVFYVSDKKQLRHISVDLEEESGNKVKKMKYEDVLKCVLKWNRFPHHKKNPGDDLSFYEYNKVEKELTGKGNGEVVGEDIRDLEDFDRFMGEFSEFLSGKCCFLVNEKEREDINNLYAGKKGKEDKNQIDIRMLKDFRAGSGMSSVNKWFDDEEGNSGATAIVSTKQGPVNIDKQNVVLESLNGDNFNVSIGLLLSKSALFNKAMWFAGSELESVIKNGSMNVLMSANVLDQYLSLVFSENMTTMDIRIVLEVMIQCVMYEEREDLIFQCLSRFSFILDEQDEDEVMLKLLEVGHRINDIEKKWCPFLNQIVSRRGLGDFVEKSFDVNAICGKFEVQEATY